MEQETLTSLNGMHPWNSCSKPNYRRWYFLLLWIFSKWFSNGEYDYQNVSIEIAVPNTPFTISGGAGFTGMDDEGGNNYSDYSLQYQQAFLA